MTIATWIVSGLLAAAYLLTGVMKLTRPVSALGEMMPYTKDLPVWMTRTIGALEVLGAIGLIVPWLTGIAPILTPIAAVALALLQVVALIFHVVRKEVQPGLAFNVVLFAAAVFIAVARFAGF